MGPHPAVAAIRVAVRRVLADLPPGTLVVAAVSGGADSLALAAGLAFAAPRAGLRAGALTVDHGLQPGAAARAAATAAILCDLGLAPVEVLPVTVTPGGRGPEAAARQARYAALDVAAQRLGAQVVLLGHTRDDQAETVLLGLARGSGARSLAGMAPVAGRYRRPLLDLPRATTRAACAAQRLTPHEDPHNADPAYARPRVRFDALPALERTIGPGVAGALARTAALLRDDADALDALAARAAADAATPDGGLSVATVAGLPAAVRRRVLRRAALAAGVPAAGLAAVHVAAMDALVTAWHGQGAVSLPGGVSARRRCGTLLVVPGSDRARGDHRVPPADLDADIERILIPSEEIAAKVGELAKEIAADYAGKDVVLVGVLKGACVVMADLVRALPIHVTIEFMAVSSYGAGTSSSGVVRIMKDLDRDITGKHVLVVEDIIDSGLTLSWLLRNLRSRGPASVEVCALLRKPDAAKVDVPIRYRGFDIPNEFVVGYGLDYAERYRNLPYVGTLKPEVYA